MLPVNGILSDDIAQLCFKWRSLKVLYTCMLQFICISEFLMITFMLYSVGLTFDYFATWLNYGIGIYTTLYLLYRAVKWREFMQFWYDHEKVFLQTPYSNFSLAVAFQRKVKVVGFSFIGFTIGELSIGSIHVSSIEFASILQSTTFSG